MMQTFVRPSRDLRNHYAEISEMLKDHNHVIITNHGRGESVLINIEDYAKYEIKYLPLAVQDLNDIARYLSGFYPQTARRVLKEMREKITKLGDTPRMCEVYALDPTYRKLVADQYLVFYHVNENVKVVEKPLGKISS